MTTRHQLGSRQEWLSARRIGSSDVPALLGLSRYRGPWDVRERLVDGRSDDSTSPDAERGVLLEPVVLRRYARASGNVVERTPNTLWTREDWASATPDALVPRMRRGDLVVEAKTDRRAERWGEPQTIERWETGCEAIVRPDYYLQVQHQLWVLDLLVADLAVLVPGDDPFLPELRVYRLLRDEEVVASLVERLSAWWRKHVVAGAPLEADGSAAASRWLARMERSGSRPARPGEVALAAAFETAGRTEREARETKHRLGQLLAAVAAPAKRLDLPVGHVTIVTSAGRSTLDERALLADHPELAPVLDEYRRAGDPTVHARIYGLGGTE